MRVGLSGKHLGQLDVDLAVCFAHEGDPAPRAIPDARLRAALGAAMVADGFKGRRSDILLWNLTDDSRTRRYAVIGLGPESGGSRFESIRLGCIRAARTASSHSARRLGLCLPETPSSVRTEFTRAAAEGALLGAYQFDRYLHDPARRPVRLQSITIAANGDGTAMRPAVDRGVATARATCFARDLVNEAPSRLDPSALARVAAKVAREFGLNCRILAPEKLEKLGMHALLAVARGSRSPAQVVHLKHRPARHRAKDPRVVLVGKGVTFDSGGLNLKPGASMLHMKGDMSGAAAVLATMTTLRDLRYPFEVHGVLGLVENMTGGAAYKPGDILDTYAGKTVEVGDTDAEGRLVLCDLLAWAADQLAPTYLVDIATLTGAVVVALGTRASGLFSRSDALRDQLLAAAAAGGEKLWPLPLYDEYLELLQKGPADLCNVGGRWGGAITAALFLGEFVPRNVAWAHLDIAGPAFSEKESPDSTAGGTGAGVATLVRWLEELASS